MYLREIWLEGVDCIIWFRIGIMAGSCEHGNERVISIKDEEYLD
jgi:hypothetical protein